MGFFAVPPAVKFDALKSHFNGGYQPDVDNISGKSTSLYQNCVFLFARNANLIVAEIVKKKVGEGGSGFSLVQVILTLTPNPIATKGVRIGCSEYTRPK